LYLENNLNTFLGSHEALDGLLDHFLIAEVSLAALLRTWITVSFLSFALLFRFCMVEQPQNMCQKKAGLI